MAWKIPQSVTQAALVVDLTTTDSVFVAANVLIAATADRTIFGTGSNHEVRIDGVVANGANQAIKIGDDATVDTNNFIHIRAGGQVEALQSHALVLHSFASRIVNEGSIHAGGIGIAHWGINGATTTTIDNSGTIDAGSYGFVRESADSTEKVVFNNSGLLKGGLFAYQGNPFGAATLAIDEITNTGTIIGTINLGAGDDLYDGRLGTVASSVLGDLGNDRLYAGSGNNSLYGQDGNDTLMGGAGADYLSGGTGTDRASYSSATAGVIVSLANTAINTGDALGDTYNSIENLSGSNFNDSLYGNSAANAINGGAGNDVIKGYAGNDTLTGGSGSDTFNFNTALNAATNVDTITDFNVAADTIQLDDAIFTVLAVGTLAAAGFAANGTGLAGDSSDRIIYETDTGKLFYDRDGSGVSFDGIQFATVSTGLSLTNADFVVI